MIGKVLRGGQVGGLVRYLYGPGRANEHLNPRIVAGWRAPDRLEPAVSESGGRDVRRLVRLLSEPAEAAGLGLKDRPVYHLVVASAKADAGRGLGPDPALSDEVWAQIAADLMDRTGLAPTNSAGMPASEGVRWVAVRHDLPGAEHVHIVATLATESGRRVSPRNDFYRVGEGCRAAEQTYGLRTTGARDRTAAKRVSRAESEKASRAGWDVPVRVTLRREVRAAAGAAGSVEGFLGRLRDIGLVVKERHSELDGALTGYAVALAGQADAAGGLVFYSGGKLAADLTLPKLAARWVPAGEAAATRAAADGHPDRGKQQRPNDGAGLSEAQRTGLWEQAIDAARQATAAIGVHRDDPAGAADAAWAASDFLASTARLVGGRRGGPLTAAAEDYDRAARRAWGRLPEPSLAGSGLRAASGLLAAARTVRTPENAQLLALLAQLAAVAEAVARMRTEQDRATQAAAAKQAAGQIHAEHDRRLVGTAAGPGRGARSARVAEAGRRQGPAASPQRPGRSR